MEENASFWPLFFNESMGPAHDDNSFPGPDISQCIATQTRNANWTELLGSIDSVSVAETDPKNYDPDRLRGFNIASPAHHRRAESTAYADLSTTNSTCSSPTIHGPTPTEQQHFQQWQMVDSSAGFAQTPLVNRYAWTQGRDLGQFVDQTFPFAADSNIPHLPTSHPPNFFDNVPYAPMIDSISQDESNRESGTAWDHYQLGSTMQDGTVADEGDDDDGRQSTEPCYAQLLYRCLKEAPGHTLSLRELYEWVSRRSQKAKDPKNRGWQNSVRHNLSMNAAFQRVTHASGLGVKPKGSLWRLTDQALAEGVISTTRYRKDPKRKTHRRGTPALSRQRSGAKGGQATRDATRRREALLQSNQPYEVADVPQRNYGWQNHGPAGYSYEPCFVRSTQPSPQPGSIQPHASASPYFVESSAYSQMASLPPLSAPQSPPTQLQLRQGRLAKQNSFLNFGMLPLDYSDTNLFGDHDPQINPDTPSLTTEASCVTDDGMPLFYDYPMNHVSSFPPFDLTNGHA